MAVADVFTAVPKSRPYRKGMNTAEVKAFLGDMVSSGAIDARIVKALTDNYESVNMLKKQAQLKPPIITDNFCRLNKTEELKEGLRQYF